MENIGISVDKRSKTSQMDIFTNDHCVYLFEQKKENNFSLSSIY